jgi:CBS domain-containing protein
MKVKEIMEKDPPIVNDRDELIDAIKRINDRGIGRVIVTSFSNNKVIGVISTRDIINVVVNYCPINCFKDELNKISKIKVTGIMSNNPITVFEDDEIIEALNLMVSRNFGSLPVVKLDNSPIGIITERNLLLIFRDIDRVFPVNKFMTKKVTTIHSEVLVTEAAKQMLRRGFRRLPVVDENGKVIGIFTAADAIKLITKSILKNNPELFFGKKVKDVMTQQVYSIDPNYSVNDAAMILLTKSIGSLLILDREGKINGIITERDLLIALHHQLHLKFI